MNTLVKLNNNHYVVVDDSEIKEGDWYLDDTNQIRQSVVSDEVYWKSRKEYKKITHSTKPFGGSATAISLHDVKELTGTGQVDVEKKADEMGFYDSAEDNKGNITTKAFIAGYNQAIEDNKEKKYTEDDISYAIGLYLENKSIKEIIQSLKPKTQWEIEIVNGKIKMI